MRLRTIFDYVRAQAEADFTPTSQPKPTDARPGSAEKVRILAARLQNGEELFHPDDKHCFAPTIHGRSYADLALASVEHSEEVIDG